VIVGVVILLLAGTTSALWIHQRQRGEATTQDDAPARLLEWAVGLLPPQRADWGQAMLGELDHLHGGSKRFRFVLGCAVGIVVPPPWGPVVPVAALASVAVGSAVLFGIGFAHFGLAANPWNWVMLPFLAALVTSCLVAASVLLRRPGVAGPGLVGGLVVAGTWLAFSEFTYAGVLSPINSVGDRARPALFLAVPLVVGVGCALGSRSALVGQRAIRLAGASAGLVMFFVSTIAVLAIDGGPRDPGVGVAGGVSESFLKEAMLFLFFLPLATASIGWVSATLASRVRLAGIPERMRNSTSIKASGRAIGRMQERSVRPSVPRAALVAVVVMAAALVFLAK
jgi:hypothetical protein